MASLATRPNGSAAKPAHDSEGRSPPCFAPPAHTPLADKCIARPSRTGRCACPITICWVCLRGIRQSAHHASPHAPTLRQRVLLARASLSHSECSNAFGHHPLPAGDPGSPRVIRAQRLPLCLPAKGRQPSSLPRYIFYFVIDHTLAGVVVLEVLGPGRLAGAIVRGGRERERKEGGERGMGVRNT